MPTRYESHNPLQDEDVAAFTHIMGPHGVITDPDILSIHNRDWMGKYTGSSRVLLKPKTREQVSELLSYCSLRRLPVVPQGGNTGLVGGSVPVFDEVILSLSGMNRVLSFDPTSGALVCEAGCILQSLDEHVAQHGFTMPLDLGAKGSCQIGGNVATNAGGLRLLRYGSLHGTVLGLEVVLADGTVLDLLRTLRKDNTGYDLKQLFIGSEGTLGVVTAVSIACPPRPASVQLAFLACESFEKVQGVLAAARRGLGEILSACEFLDAASMELVTGHLEGVKSPLAGPPAPFYMLIETSGSSMEHDTAKVEAFLSSAMEQGLVQDGTLAQSEGQAAAVWRVREGVTEALLQRGAVYKYDLSMPVPDMYALVEEMRRRLAHKPQVVVVGYGHVGDGNLHLNISCPTTDDEVLELVEPFVYEWTTQRRGSISAEHGLGLMKAQQIGYSKSDEAVRKMVQLKHLFDPRNILNPYKLLPG